jgi:hypothetical protein
MLMVITGRLNTGFGGRHNSGITGRHITGFSGRHGADFTKIQSLIKTSFKALK